MAVITVAVERGNYPPIASTYFNFEELDAFHAPEVLRTVYGSSWFGLVITAGDMAFLHAYQPQALPQGEGLDIDPFIGYAGPMVTSSASAEFCDQAATAYSAWCREQGIIAEIIRFNPILRNDAVYALSSTIEVFKAKDIVVVACNPNEEAQLASFSTKCRSSVKRGIRDCTFEKLDKTTNWDAFVAFYMASLHRIGADPRWSFSPEFFARAAQSSVFQVYAVRHEDKLASVSLVIEHPLAGYYFLAASSEQPVQGANEYLVYGISQRLAQMGCPRLVLGGGNSADEDDALLRFKKKFAPALIPLMLGKLVHEPQAFNQLVAAAIARRPELEAMRFFLKYRL
ncbi:hypothetical protein AUC43_19725 [Hymenobacter sedentarius]|uniref:BioF2-like acetyltransferase domain-containing protein n=1 Tax=Hymenobacter sedentarius TaxID=1411621 RepID=A0A0U3T2E5_9BACT|nr:GNAT family N-acetyltransferase [Hymenobacter sedentarius]ALW87107.1 hypothetical protein AUC43_19725 [Hymenobacter sedentarius]